MLRFSGLIFLSLALLTSCNTGSHSDAQATEKKQSVSAIYKLVLRTLYKPSDLLPPDDTSQVPGEVNAADIQKLDEPLKAMAAFYAAMGGTMCNGDSCELGTALGLGRQGSELQKLLITKYFPGDKVAELLIKQNCYQRPSGASSFTDYEYLNIIDAGDTVSVEYNLWHYNRGETEVLTGPDIYLWNGNNYKKLQRSLWKGVDD